ncbi:hypothetical protein LPN01_07425 [Sphingomonas sp. A2-49]|uniref:M56 family metallopeptidase n=1 Tax=Sphingomonas sp. A2-49 TaxID=1391375 RepID=UPI0021D082BF|nr:M56 family metallopeptidase [Sphingomonas sp. A2-49]MCU6453904.1 hypothetical protein [Sphingomonas sp. A2-49]
MTDVLVLALKSSILMALALGGCRLLARGSAVERAAIIKIGLILSMALPLLALLPPLTLPPLPIPRLPADVGSTLRVAPAAASGVPRDEHGPAMEYLLDGIVTVYLAGVAILSVRLVTGLLHLSRVSRASAPLADPIWTRIAHGVALPRRTRVRTSDGIDGPLTWGVLRPDILIDRATAASPGAAQMVLAHEAAHIRHADWAFLILARVLVILLWFNPLAWHFARRLSEACETVADMAVLRHGDRVPYAELLVRSARRVHAPALPVSGLASPSALVRRVRAILHDEADPARPTRCVPIVAALVGGVGLCWIANAHFAPADAAPPGWRVANRSGGSLVGEAGRAGDGTSAGRERASPARRTPMFRPASAPRDVALRSVGLAVDMTGQRSAVLAGPATGRPDASDAGAPLEDGPPPVAVPDDRASVPMTDRQRDALRDAARGRLEAARDAQRDAELAARDVARDRLLAARDTERDRRLAERDALRDRHRSERQARQDAT